MKKEYIALAIIIIALSAYLVLHKTDSTHYTLPVLSKLSDTDINHIDIVHKEVKVSLSDDGSAWIVGENKFPADQEAVKTMVDAIKNLSLTALVSESKSYNRYELDDENKITVTAMKGTQVVRTFDVGKVAGSYHHTFVKLENDPRVYHADGNLNREFAKKEEDLTDKAIMKINRATVIGIKAKDSEVDITVEKKQEPVNVDVAEDEKPDAPPASPGGGTWTDASGAEKGNDKINAFISQFTSLSCEAYIKGKTKEDFKEPLLEVSFNAEKVYTLSVFPKKDDEEVYPAISSERDFPFTLSASKVDNILKKLKEI